MINSYRFGKIVINDHTYKKDVIILPDEKVISPWWRKSGHKLAASDINEILGIAPNVLVVGTGRFGMMKPLPGFTDDLELKGIRVIVLPTKQAVDMFNTLTKKPETAAACFHLTC